MWQSGRILAENAISAVSNVKRRTKVIVLIVLALVALGWYFQRWGQPVPVAYERVAANRYRSLVSPSTVYIAVDENSDGTVDRIYPEDNPARGFHRPAATDADARWLLLCVDGVPFEEIQALWNEGYFREFFPPSEVISTFPSESETAMTDLFHADAVPGYEHRYFDRKENRLRGGLGPTLTGKGVPYLSLLDYDMPGILKGFNFTVPHKGYRADLGRFRKRFLASSQKVFLAHIASGDAIYHVLPRGETRTLLIELDALLRDLYFASAGKLRILFFSDHGNNHVRSQAVPLKQFLGARAWHLADSLSGSRDVVVPAYGLVGFMAVYCQPESRLELASDLAEMEGVDFVVSEIPDGVAIAGSRGKAQLEWTREGRHFRYRTERGDPLALMAVVAELSRAGKVNRDGWIAEADLARATLRHVYPDGAYRLHQWATNHVLNRADILVSLAPGYYHGRASFGWVVTLLSTHGSFDRAQSVGFAMSTDGPLAPVLRTRDLLPAEITRGKASPPPH